MVKRFKVLDTVTGQSQNLLAADTVNFGVLQQWRFVFAYEIL